MKKIFISHTDMDGVGSFVLLDYFQLKDFDEVYSWDYGFFEIPECRKILDEADEIVIADLSLEEENYNELIAAGKRVEIYDHHDTSIWLATKPNCVHDKNRSGTKIFFDEYILKRVGRVKNIVRTFVDLVDVYDRWVLESPLRSTSENLQRVWSSYATWRCPDNLMKHDRFIAQMSKKLETTDEFDWNVTELSYIEKSLEREAKTYQEALSCLQLREDNEGRMFGVWRAWGKISLTAAKLLAELKDAEYVICLQDSPDNWGKISFRSRENGFELPSLAGVNGHLAAAGTVLTGEEAAAFWDNKMCFKYAKNWQENTPPIEMCGN